VLIFVKMLSYYSDFFKIKMNKNREF